MRLILLLTLTALTLPSAALCQTKPSIRGLVTMGKLNFMLDPGIEPDNTLREADAHPGLYSGAVVVATWDQLEPQSGQYDFATIEQGLANIRAYNAAHSGAPLAAKLRVFAGLHAPAWVKQLDGGPVMLRRMDQSAPFGKFWAPGYRAAWRALQTALAARYDTDPLVREVAISSCSSSTAEPFIVPLNRENGPALRAAGYNEAAMEQCLRDAPDDYAAWTHVAIDYTFNPWRSVADGRPMPDPQFTIEVMDAFRQRLGSRGVIANHGLVPDYTYAAQTVIDEMQRLGPPIEFQTRSPNEDWDGAVAEGEHVGMTELEIWNTRAAGGPAQVTTQQLRQWRAQLLGQGR